MDVMAAQVRDASRKMFSFREQERDWCRSIQYVYMYTERKPIGTLCSA